MQSLQHITSDDIAKLHAKFVVPIIVREMMNGNEPFDGVAEFTLHDIIGGMKPDTALLCMALCAQHVAAQCGALPIARVLGMESEKIVHEYGGTWLAHAQGRTLDDGKVVDLLIHVPEDLECLSDLAGALQAQLKDQDCVPAQICSIFQLQAEAHKAAAETELEELNLLPRELPEGAQAAVPRASLVRSALEAAEGNVVKFPSSPRS